MEAERENCKVMSDIEDEFHFKELYKETENSVVIDAIVLESDTSESGSNVNAGAGVTPKTDGGSLTIGASCSLCASRPPPPFLSKIYDMLENIETNSIISWSSTGTSFIVWDPHLFSANILPQYFRHNNFQSFVCQLNTYGFKKVNWDKWEFKNECFQKGNLHLLKHIKRRDQHAQRMKKPVRREPKVDVDTSSSDAEKELQTLMNVHDELKMEIVKLKEQQGMIEQQFASVKNNAMSNAHKSQRMVMFMMQTFLSKQREFSSNAVEKVIPLMSGDIKSVVGNFELNSEHFTIGKKPVMDELANVCEVEEQTTNYQSNTYIELEDLIGESFDWAEYVRELQESNSSQI